MRRWAVYRLYLTHVPGICSASYMHEELVDTFPDVDEARACARQLAMDVGQGTPALVREVPPSLAGPDTECRLTPRTPELDALRAELENHRDLLAAVLESEGAGLLAHNLRTRWAK